MGEIHEDLGRRERQIMEIIYRLGRATVADVIDELPDPPTNSAVRGMLRYLESKGYLQHEQDGQRYVYFPTVGREQAQRSAVRHLVRTFFGGSKARAVAALLDIPAKDVTDGDLDRLADMIRRARKEGR
jgi:predicted transcriptional regulator